MLWQVQVDENIKGSIGFSNKEVTWWPLPLWSQCFTSESHSVVSDSLWPHGLYNPWNSPNQDTGVGSLSLLQGIFPTQGSNPGLPHYRWILYQLSHKGSPRILEWVAYPFSRGSFWPRNGSGVSCIAGGLFTNWAIREVHQVSLINTIELTWIFGKKGIQVHDLKCPDV